MRRFLALQLVVVILLFSGIGTAGEDTILPVVVLKGDDGGTAHGEEWNSGDLTGRMNLILYVYPGKKKETTPLIEKIDSLNYSPDTLWTTFIVNSKATVVPVFMLRMMCKRREKANENIQYVIDQNEVLINKWNFTDDYINVLLLDPSGKILHRHAAEITEEYIDELINVIDNAVQNNPDSDN